MLKSPVDPIEFATKKIEMFVLKKFKKTNDNNDKYHTTDIINIIKKNGLVISVKKIVNIINILNLGKYKQRIAIDNKIDAGFTNIKFTGNKK